MTNTNIHPVSGLPDDTEIADLTAWRHELHRHPELSGQERETARRVLDMIAPTEPDQIVTGLGGHGVAAVYAGAAPGPTILLRCELDALPIVERGAPPYRSETDGKAHLCGHDGHMAILMGVARWLGRNRPDRGRAVVLFQPAEEDGSGAQRVLADPRFEAITPDYALALHNMPGLPLGHAALAEGVVNCASRGMKIVLSGRTAHASQPETGVSPVPALSCLTGFLTALGKGGPQTDPDFSLVTVTHLSAGAPAFGIAPGDGELWVTLRTQRDAGMDALVARAESLVAEQAEKAGLVHTISYHDVFRHCENAPEAVALLSEALDTERIPRMSADLPMRASEDFGRFGDRSRAAMMLLGAGPNCPALHNPDYDFPDALIAIGVRVFIRCLHARLFEDQEPV